LCFGSILAVCQIHAWFIFDLCSTYIRCVVRFLLDVRSIGVRGVFCSRGSRFILAMLKKNKEFRKLRKLLAGEERRWRERGVELFGFYEAVSFLHD
jgi:hypothetical protein